ncbi:MAG: hypothetical protein ACRDY7_11100, partial [Acidimicrobiia bacterium]
MKRQFTVLACAVLLAGGCGGGDDDDGERARADSDPASPSVSTATTAPLAPVDMAVTAEELAPELYGFELPAEVTGGVVTMQLTNSGALQHEAGVVRVGATPLDQVRQDLDVALGGDGPIPDYLEFHGGVGEIAGGTQRQTTFKLPEGDYVMYCAITDLGVGGTLEEPKPHYDTGMIEPFKVRGDNGASLPGGLPKIVAGEYGFELDPLPPGNNTVLFENLGPAQMHLAAFLEFPAGVDEQQALAILLGQSDPAGRPPTQTAVVGPFVPGAGGTFRLDLKA